MQWVKSLSYKYTHLDENDKVKDSTVHGGGHADDGVTASVAAYVLCSFIVLLMATFYMIHRIYIKKDKITKYFSKPW